MKPRHEGLCTLLYYVHKLGEKAIAITLAAFKEVLTEVRDVTVYRIQSGSVYA